MFKPFYKLYLHLFYVINHNVELDEKLAHINSLLKTYVLFAIIY